MKMVFMTYKDSQDHEVMKILEDLDIPAFTRWKDVQAKSRSGRPRMGTDVWPGLNYAITFAIEEETAKELLLRVREFNEGTKFEGIKAMCWRLDDVCWKE